jgi:hypothetical protein
LALARPLRLRVFWVRLLPRLLAVARDLVRLELLREELAALRPDRARPEDPRVDVLRELVDFVPALFFPRPVDFFVAAIDILSLLCCRTRTLASGVLSVTSGNLSKVVRPVCTFVVHASCALRDN